MTFVRREARAFVEIFALCGVAVAQPLLDLFGRSPHQFVFRGATSAELVAFAALVVLVPPAVVWAASAPAGLLGARVRRAVHSVVIAGLVWVLAVQALRPLLDGVLLLLVAGVAGVLAAVAHARWEPVRTWLAFVALAPIAFVAMFLLGSPTAHLYGGEPVLALEAGVGNPVPVVVVVLDELPLASLVDEHGEIDRDLHPNLAALADQSHWFRNATAVSNFTWHAMPSIVTGDLPRDGEAPFAADHPQNLFTLLGGTYELDVVESLSRLCPESLCDAPESGPGDGLGGLLRDAREVLAARLSPTGPQGAQLDAFVEPVVDEPDEEVRRFEVPTSRRIDAFLGGIEDDSLALHFLHVLLPHQPFRYLPSGRTYEGAAHVGWSDDRWDEDPWPATLGRQRHLLQLAYTDQVVGQIVDRLRATGVYDDALVVLTADHGISFRPGGPIRLTEEQPLDDDVAAQLLWVPFLVKLPGQQEGSVSDADVRTIDALPTIADVLDIELPEPVDGQSVFATERVGESKPFRYSTETDGGFRLGDRITVDTAAGLEALEDAAVSSFAPGRGGVERLWRIGPAPQLLGTAAASLPEVATIGFDPTVEHDPEDGTVPAMIVAPVDAEVGEPLAVAVDGTVVATATAFREDPWVVVAAMLDEGSFEAGTNEITIHRVPAEPQN